MTIALVDHTAGSAASGNVTTAAINSTGATLLVGVVSYIEANPPSSVADSKGNIWSLFFDIRQVVNAASQAVYYSVPTTVGSGNTFTVTIAATCSVSFSAWSGTAASSPADVHNGTFDGTAAATSIAPGSITPSANNYLVIQGFTHGNADITGLSENSGVLTTLDTTTRLAGSWPACYTKYVIQTTAAAINPTWSWTTGVSAAATASAFKIFSAAAGVNRPYGAILG